MTTIKFRYALSPLVLRYIPPLPHHDLLPTFGTSDPGEVFDAVEGVSRIMSVEINPMTSTDVLNVLRRS